MKTIVRVVFALSLVTYTAAIVFRNPDPVPVNLVFVELAGVPLWMIIGGGLLLGIGVTALLMSIPLLRMRLRLRRQDRQLGALEQEVHSLRTLPIDAEDAATAGSSSDH